ncbi:esterase [Parafrankia colletiae]|uniref:Acyl-CoA:diacylglycerol acyltransferase n=1 Tax=Parafrankia colletiae TaxID=573497 RepID=A0A1S1QII8_9ACTN|nr:alpha/beta hydrolase-fold protein [Parafrankia colletiae]MCK9900896.1 alpha/beta hydrolase-fold protein [Frankia sp. Cpl3]OHV34593.1 esterase [Parafrankia colletiae]
MPASRRALLIAAAAGGLAAGCGTDSPPPSGPTPAGGAGTAGGVTPPPAGDPSPSGQAAASPTVGPVAVRRTTFASTARGRHVGMVVVAPTTAGAPSAAGAGELPVCLVLHGRGDNADRAVGLLGLDAHLTAALATGTAPFALVTLDGGETYWHRRASGDNPEGMILGEVLPRLAAQGLRTDRIAATGWSMGGYGALLLARRHPDLVVAVAASSPAMWHSYRASAPGAFDSSADFTEHAILGTPPVPGVAYRIDCGEADPFYSVSREAADALQAQERNFGPGGHTPAYWSAVIPAQLAFLGHQLARAT